MWDLRNFQEQVKKKLSLFKEIVLVISKILLILGLQPWISKVFPIHKNISFFSHNSSQQFWKKNTTSYPRLPHTQIHRPVLLTVIFSTSKSGVSVGINLMHLVSEPSSLSSLRTITQLSLKLQIKQRSSLMHIICLAVELPWVGILCFYIFSQSSNIFSHKRNWPKAEQL